jgi:type IV pilus assembly protein PilP
MSRYILPSTLLVLGSLLVLPGCGDDGGGADAPTERPDSAAAPKDDILTVASAVEEEPGPKFTYNMIGKRDPFRSFISIEVVRGDSDSPLGPLQLHEIDQYQLAGVVWNMDSPKALIEDPEGVGHVVELGTLVGKNWGRITQIKPTGLVITEEYRDPIENELIINEITMKLPDPSLDD